MVLWTYTLIFYLSALCSTVFQCNTVSRYHFLGTPNAFNRLLFPSEQTEKTTNPLPLISTNSSRCTIIEKSKVFDSPTTFPLRFHTNQTKHGTIGFAFHHRIRPCGNPSVGAALPISHNSFSKPVITFGIRCHFRYTNMTADWAVYQPVLAQWEQIVDVSSPVVTYRVIAEMRWVFFIQNVGEMPQGSVEIYRQTAVSFIVTLRGLLPW